MILLPRDSDQTERLLITCAFALFLLTFLSYAFILNGGNSWNTNSRIALTLSIVERGELIIEPLQTLTGDKAFVAGHYVSDKAPGMSFTALPVVLLSDQFMKRLRPGFQWTAREGQQVKYSFNLEILTYLVTITTSALFTAVAVAALFLAAWRLGTNVVGALIAALAYGLGTPTWGWATAFFGHAMSGAMLVLAFTGTVWFIPRRGEE